jgi:transposase
MARRKYSQEYKQDVVLLVKESGSPVAEIARSLGINDNALRRWVKEYSEPGKKVFPGQGNARDEEVARLNKELTQVKKERDFLKEAAAYFAKESK